jgi:hypothetical protein
MWHVWGTGEEVLTAFSQENMKEGGYLKYVNVHLRIGQEDPEGEQKYRSTLSLTSALDGMGWSTPRPGHFTPEKDPVPLVQEVGWTSGPG